MNLLDAFLLCLCVVLITHAPSSAQTTPMTSYLARDSGRMIDSYGRLSLKEEKERLNNLASLLGKEPLSKGYIVVYAGSKDQVSNIRVRACRAMRHLLGAHGVNPKQIISAVITGGHRERFTVELWI